MNDWTSWQDSNSHFLAAGLAWLRLKLERLGGEAKPKTAKLARAKGELSKAGSAQPPPALIWLSRRLGLSPFEQEVLLLCAALELDTRIAGLCSSAQDNPQRPYPTLGLALSLFDEPSWDVWSPERPLRYWRLVEIQPTSGLPLMASPLRIDERILHYLKGLHYLDERLAPFLHPVDFHGEETSLPPSQVRLVEKLLGYLTQVPRGMRLPVILLLGADSSSKQALSSQAVARLNLRLYRLPVELLPRQPGDLETISRLWQRESLLSPLALYLDASEVLAGAWPEGLALTLNRFLAQGTGIIFLDSRDAAPIQGRGVYALDVAKPTPVEQREAWVRHLGPGAGDIATLLAGQFNLNLAAITQIAQTLMGEETSPGQNGRQRLWEACLASTRPRMELLAQRLEPKAVWEDLVLPQEESALLRHIAAQVRQRLKVYDDWGFRRRLNRGLGVTALFTGESGTGKTMAAEVLARELCLNLYRIDLSAVVSKYIGETEKNLRQVFDAAEDGGAILFFDEADALFGKRSEVRDSHDRYANIEVNYLLQRMEGYQGLAILATNMKSALDQAFLRRLRFIVNLPFPGPAERRRIWGNIFPPETPREALDLDRLARLNLTGGSIHNIALQAAFLAAQAGAPVAMPVVLEAARTEFRKLEKPVNDLDFRWVAPAGTKV